MTRFAILAAAFALGGAWQFVQTSSADPVADPQAPPFGAALAPDGTLLSIASCEGRRVTVRGVPPAGDAWKREVVLTDLPPDARVVDVRVAAFRWTTERPRLALGLVVRRAGQPRSEYRYAVDVDRADGAWTTSAPIFEDDGKPWRVAEVRQNIADGDTIELLFMRGFNSPRGSAPAGGLEVRQFTDVCAEGGPVGISGKDRLVTYVPAK